MKILHITNNYPTSNHPIFGIFVKEQITGGNDIPTEPFGIYIGTKATIKKD